MKDGDRTASMSDAQGEALPDTLRAWVDERADAGDEDPSAVLSRAVTLYRLVEEHAEAASEGPATDDDSDGVDDLLEALDAVDDQRDRLAAVDDRMTAVEDDVDEKIDDIRSRVIQVKREGDRERDALEDRLGAVESTVDGGFQNFESILSGLTDETETLDGKLTRLATVVISLRRRAAAAERRLEGLDTATELKEAANRHGVTKGKCDSCSGAVSLGLLTEARCPHCDAVFADIEPTRRPFSAARLTTASHPALTAGDEPTGSESGDETTASASDAETETESKPETVQTAAADLLEESNRV